MAVKVTLKRNWFGPDGVLYEARHNPVSVPVSLLPVLPKDAQYEGKEEEEAEDKPKKLTKAEQAAADKKAAEDKAEADKKAAADEKEAADKKAAEEAAKQSNLNL